MQSGSIPPLGPVTTDGIFGYWFQTDIDCRAVAIQYLEEAGRSTVRIGQIWNAAQTLVLGMSITSAGLNGVVDAVPVWRKLWLHPRVPILASTPYLVAIIQDGSTSIYRYGSILLLGDYVNGHVRALAVGPDAAPGGRYDIPSSGFVAPPSSTTDNLYSIDVLLEAT